MAGEVSLEQWFGLSYANYLVVPRAVLQSMPEEWQAEMASLLEEMNKRCEGAGVSLPSYRVRAVDEAVRFTREAVPHYRHAPNVFEERTK